MPGTIPEEEKQEVKKAIDGTKSLSKALKDIKYNLAKSDDGGYQIEITAKSGETVRLNGESLDEMLNIGVTTLSVKAPDGVRTLDIVAVRDVTDGLIDSEMFETAEIEYSETTGMSVALYMKDGGEDGEVHFPAVLTLENLKALASAGCETIILKKTDDKEDKDEASIIIDQKAIIEIITDKLDGEQHDCSLAIDQAGDITVLIDGKPVKDSRDEIAALIEKQNTEESLSFQPG